MSLELLSLFTEKTKFLELYDRLLDVNSNDLEVDYYINSLSKSTGINKRCLYLYNGNWYYKNGLVYFFKDLPPLEALNEIIGEYISNYFDLKTVNYSLAKVIHSNSEPSLGITSLNFCNPKYSYKSVHDLGFNTYPLMPFLSNLEIFNKYFKENNTNKDFILSLKKLFVRDFFTGENDRRGDNLLFEVGSNSISLAPLFDYEWSFSYKSDYYSYDNSLAVMDITDKRTLEYLKNDKEFQELFSKLLTINLSKMFKEIEKNFEILIPNSSKSFYLEQEERVKELVYKTVIK